MDVTVTLQQVLTDYSVPGCTKKSLLVVIDLESTRKNISKVFWENSLLQAGNLFLRPDSVSPRGTTSRFFIGLSSEVVVETGFLDFFLPGSSHHTTGLGSPPEKFTGSPLDKGKCASYIECFRPTLSVCEIDESEAIPLTILRTLLYVTHQCDIGFPFAPITTRV